MYWYGDLPFLGSKTAMSQLQRLFFPELKYFSDIRLVLNAVALPTVTLLLQMQCVFPGCTQFINTFGKLKKYFPEL